MISKDHPIFLDTSILIKSFTGTPVQRNLLSSRVAAASEAVIGSVVRCEFRRRFLLALEYLQAIGKKVASLVEVEEHVLLRLKHDARLREMCIDFWFNYVRRREHARGKLFDLEEFVLLVENLRELAWQTVRTRFHPKCIEGIGCAGGNEEDLDYVEARIPPGDCEELAADHGVDCAVGQAMRAHRKEGRLKLIADGLASTPFKITPELTKAKNVLPKLISKPQDAAQELPCKKHGDLAVALESTGIDHVYTVNVRESRALCSILGQSLIVLRKQLDEEIELPSSGTSADWVKTLRARNSL